MRTLNRNIIAAACLGALAISSARAAIVVESAIGGDGTNGGSASVTWTRSVNAGTNLDRLLLVSIIKNTASNQLDNIPTVTYNGDGLATLQSVNNAAAGRSQNINWYYLLAPDTGTNTLQVSWADGAADGQVGTTGTLMVWALSGAAQNVPTINSATPTDVTTNPSLTVTPPADGAFLATVAATLQNNALALSKPLSTGDSPVNLYASNNNRASAIAADYDAALQSGSNFNISWTGGPTGSNGDFVVTAVTVAPVPEPASLSLLALAGLVGLRRRR